MKLENKMDKENKKLQMKNWATTKTFGIRIRINHGLLRHIRSAGKMAQTYPYSLLSRIPLHDENR